MAIIDPRARALAHIPQGVQEKASERFKLKIHEISPDAIEPLGDRYVVEVIDIDERIELGQVLVVTPQAPERPGDPMADPLVERRGVLAAVIISEGNGHLLGLPDPALVMHDADGREMVERCEADVLMFFDKGDVVFVDHNAKGRALRIFGRECRIVNQIDILARISGVRLRRNDAGEWEREAAE